MGQIRACEIENLLSIANKDSKKIGFLNMNLETVIPFEYDEIYDEYQYKGKTYYIAQKEDSCGLLDIKTGEYIEKFKFFPDDTDEEKSEYINKFSVITEKDGKFGIIDDYEKFVIPPIYDKIELWNFDYPETNFKEEYNLDCKNLYLLYKDDKIGIANDKTVLKEPVFNKIETWTTMMNDLDEADEDEIDEMFMNSITSGYSDYCKIYPYFKANIDGKEGYIDIFGNTIIDFKYANVDNPNNRKLTVATTFDNTLDFINLETKKVILSVPAENIVGYSITHNHICLLTCDDNLYKIIDENGNIFASFKNTKSLNGRKLSYFNDALLIEYKRDITSFQIFLYTMKGKKIKLNTDNYSLMINIHGTNNVIAYRKDTSGSADIVDEQGNILMENLRDTICLGRDDINGFETPPVIYYTDNSDEKIVDKSIMPYESVEEDSKEEKTKDIEEKTSIYDGADFKNARLSISIDYDDDHYAFVIFNDKIKMIDKNGKTTKEIDFIVDEDDSIEDDEEFFEF